MVADPFVKNILLLDDNGKRVASKYYGDDWPTNASKLAFEKTVFTKTQRINARDEADIGMYDGFIVVFKFVGDLRFFVTGSEDENELILAIVLEAFCEAVSLVLRGTVDKRMVLDNLDFVLLCFDEIVDGGIILETDPKVICSRVTARGTEADTPLAEQTISQAFAMARDRLARSLLS